MAALVWDAVGEKHYEAGVDRGVLYLQKGGVAWNGILGVEEQDTDTVTPVYIDGTKIRNLVSIGDFEATLRAYTYPEEFLLCEGLVRHGGMYIDEQYRQEFGLSYRTHVGDDVDGQESSYKIHILYNLTASADTKSYSTFSLSPEPVEFSWTLFSRAQEAVDYRPSAHFIIDSRLWDSLTLQVLEEILYGTALSPPTLPSFPEFIEIVDPHSSLIILIHTEGEWTGIDLKNHHISTYNDEIFEIDSPTVVMIDADTFEVSTYDA